MACHGPGESVNLISLNHLATVNNNIHNIPPKEKITDFSISQVEWKCNIVLLESKNILKVLPD